MDTTFLLHVNMCLTPFERIHNASIVCRDGLIDAVGGFSALSVLDDIPSVDMTECYAIPGLIDTHVHGSGGFATMETDSGSDMSGMCCTLASHGITAFVPTVLAAAPDKMLSVLDALSIQLQKDHVGAVPVGIHIEGPYLNPVKRGAQSERAIRPVDLDEARRLLAAGDGLVRIMTFAPELDRSADLIRLLRESAVVPSMGHSSADEETVLAAIGLGASRCTHFYNGMPQLDSRNVRLTAVALTDDSVTIEIITDGVHVHRRMVDLAIRSKPLSRIVAVSDAVQGAGLPDGLYHLGGDEVRIADGHSTRVSDGTIAGSCITLDRAMRNLADFSSLSESEAVACCTVNAARSIGLYDRGEIVPGKRADIVVLNAEREVEMTIVGGRIVYTRSGEIPVCEVAANA